MVLWWKNFAGFSFMNANNRPKTNLYVATAPGSRLIPGNQKTWLALGPFIACVFCTNVPKCLAFGSAVASTVCQQTSLDLPSFCLFLPGILFPTGGACLVGCGCFFLNELGLFAGAMCK